MKENLTVIRNFLYRLFLIGFIFSALTQLGIIFGNFQGISEASKMLHVSPEYLIELILNSITVVKTFLFYCVLCPALALHWTIAKDKNLK